MRTIRAQDYTKLCRGAQLDDKTIHKYRLAGVYGEEHRLRAEAIEEKRKLVRKLRTKKKVKKSSSFTEQDLIKALEGLVL